MLKKFLCPFVGHNYTNGDVREYVVCVGDLGKVSFTQSKCTRCGHITTTARMDGNITYDNFIKVCSTSVDKAIEDTVFPINSNAPVTKGTVRTTRKKSTTNA